MNGQHTIHNRHLQPSIIYADDIDYSSAGRALRSRLARQAPQEASLRKTCPPLTCSSGGPSCFSSISLLLHWPPLRNSSRPAATSSVTKKSALPWPNRVCRNHG